MNPARVEERGLNVLSAVSATLKGYQLAFDKTAAHHAGVGHANIQWSRGDEVEGVLYELASAAEIAKMDPFERAPWNYGREVVQVVGRGKLDWAWTYFANPAFLQEGLLPSAAYLAHLLAGRAYLSDAYYGKLQDWGSH